MLILHLEDFPSELFLYIYFVLIINNDVYTKLFLYCIQVLINCYDYIDTKTENL